MKDVAITSAAAVVHRELLRTLADQARTHRLRDQPHRTRPAPHPGRPKPPGTA